MCGLVYIKRKDNKPAYKSVLKRYREQKHRGTRGYGYVAIHDNKVVSWKRAETEQEIVQLIIKETAEEILFHHRTPTSTPNIEESAHPLLIENKVLDKAYFVAHNGVIRNDDELKPKHEELGFDYVTEIFTGYTTYAGVQYVDGSKWNDSESLAIETALLLNGKKDRIEAQGSAAVIGFEMDGDTVARRFVFRNMGNPLNHDTNEHMTAITSEGKGKVVQSININLLQEDGTLVETKWFTPWSYAQTTYHKHTTYDRDDIQSTPSTVAGFLSGKQTPTLHFPKDELPPDPATKHITNVVKDSIESKLWFMSEDALWSEYDTALGKITELKAEAARIDTQLADGDYRDNELLEERAGIQIKLDETTKWADKLDNEISSRAAYTR